MVGHGCNTGAATRADRMWWVVRTARTRAGKMTRGGTQQFLSARRILPVTRDVNGDALSTGSGARSVRFVKAARTKRVTFVTASALLGMLVARDNHACPSGLAGTETMAPIAALPPAPHTPPA